MITEFSKGWREHARQYRNIFYSVQANRFSIHGEHGSSFATLDEAIAARDNPVTDGAANG